MTNHIGDSNRVSQRQRELLKRSRQERTDLLSALKSAASLLLCLGILVTDAAHPNWPMLKLVSFIVIVLVVVERVSRHSS